jgi:enoyl-CoA hydratase
MQQISIETLEQIRYERPAPGVARIVMSRPGVRNAQGLRMTYELDAAFSASVRDPEIKVIILAGDDPHFSAGHDLTETGEGSWPQISLWGDFDVGGAEGRFGIETEIYLDMCERWRALSKPTIAAVQGKCIGGGLMLAWVCDLIVASDDAMFRDPTVAMGVMGTEYFMHPWELGTRKAKEFLMLGEWMSAEEGHRLGMLNRVVTRAELQSSALMMARAIASKPQFAVRAAKVTINHAQDQAGRLLAMRQSFAMHQLTHANNELLSGASVLANGIAKSVAAKIVKEETTGD